MRISPPSRPKNPATRLRTVVFPHPDGPTRVMNSPRLTGNDSSCSATTSPNRLITPSRRTATSAPAPAAAGVMVGSTAMFDIEDLAESQELVGDREQHRGRDDVHDRQ